MKTCKHCNATLPDNARFCGKCGAQVETEIEIKERQPDKKKKLGLIVGIIIIILAILAGGLIIFSGKKKEKEYNQYIAMAEKYVEALDYEQAEAAYLEAIKIDKKQLKPYVDLAEIYIEQEEYDKAEEIIEDAEEAGANGDEETEDRRDDVENILDNIDDMIDYTWIFEPQIEADEMYYPEYFFMDSEVSLNEGKKQSYAPYAVIKSGDLLGLIDMNGEIVVPVEFESVLYDGEVYFLSKLESMMEFYVFRDDTLYQTGGLHPEEWSVFYFYSNGLTAIDPLLESIPVQAFPIQELMSGDMGDRYEQPGKYAVYYKDHLITDFIYDKCGAGSDGLVAVCQDGKWGYIDEQGNVVIPMEYDASWKRCYSYYEQTFSDFGYSASDGFVVLCKDNKYQLCDLTGKVVIPEGIFQEILPVYEGKCWVKQNGKWGVIQVTEEKEQKSTDAMQIEFEWSALNDNGEVFDLGVRLSGRMDDGSEVHLQEGYVYGEAYNKNEEVIASYVKKVENGKATLTITLLDTNGVISFEGSDHNYGEPPFPNNSITVVEGDLRIRINSKEIEYDFENGLRRGNTGVWYLVFFNIDHGNVVEFSELY